MGRYAASLAETTPAVKTAVEFANRREAWLVCTKRRERSSPIILFVNRHSSFVLPHGPLRGELR